MKLGLQLVRVLGLVALLLLALMCYGLGSAKGMAFFILLGLVFETTFWFSGFKLFSRKKKSRLTPDPERK